MFDLTLLIIIKLAAIGAGLMAGLYFAFSTFIMRSFNQLGASNAVAAMNAINQVILRSWFMPLFFASTAVFVGLAVAGFTLGELPGRWLLVSAGLIYVIGMFVATAAFNVPLNNALAAVTNDHQEQTTAWNHYYRVWTRWNHVRALCSLVACMLCIGYLTHAV